MDTLHHSLPQGTLIGERFEVQSVLGIGGFGITYKGWDQHLACEVAIKEYLPEFASRTQGDLSVRAHGARSDDYRYGLQRFLDEARTLARFRHPNVRPDDAGWGRGNRPVINVSWEDANAYTAWLAEQTGEKYRLPTEAEWEYAARAGTSTSYPWGNEASHEYANYGKEKCCDGIVLGRDQWVNTAPVGSFPSNAFGLHDMQGNITEWVQDCFHSTYVDAPTDGSAREQCDSNDRTLRGGSWYYGKAKLRSAVRLRLPATFSHSAYGFRLAKALEN